MNAKKKPVWEVRPTRRKRKCTVFGHTWNCSCVAESVVGKC